MPRLSRRLTPWLLLLLGLLAVYVLLLQPLRTELRRRAELSVEQDARLLAERLSLAIGNRLGEVQQLARVLGAQGLDERERLHQELSGLKARSPAYVWVAVVDVQGQVMASTQGWLLGRSLRGRPVFENGLRSPWFGDYHPAKLLKPHLAPSGSHEPWVADVAAPVLDDSGRVVAVVCAHLGTDWVLQLGDRTLGSRRQQELGLAWTLLQGDGRPLAHAPLRWQLPAEPPQGRAFEVQREQGQPLLVAGEQLALDASGAQRWQLLVMQDLQRAQHDQHLLNGLVLGLIAVGAVGLVLRRAPPSAGAGADPGPQALPLSGPHPAPPAPWTAMAPGLFTTLPLPLAVLDERQRLRACNPAFEACSGLAAPALRGREPLGLLLEPAAERLLRQQQQLGRDTPLPARCSLALPPSGEAGARWLQLWPLPDGGQALLLQDRSAEQQQRERADAAEQRLQLLLRAAQGDACVTLDRHGVVSQWGEAAEALTGLQQAAQQGRPLKALFEAPEAWAALLQQARVVGVAPLNAWLRGARGRRLQVQGRVYALPGGAAGPGGSASAEGFALLFSDATRAEAAMRRAHEAQAQLQALLAASPEALLLADAEGRVIRVNAAAEALLERSEAQLHGQALQTLVPGLPAPDGPPERLTLCGVDGSSRSCEARLTAAPAPRGAGRLLLLSLRECRP